MFLRARPESGSPYFCLRPTCQSQPCSPGLTEGRLGPCHLPAWSGRSVIGAGRSCSPRCNPTFCVPSQPVFLLTHGTLTFSPRDATLSLSSPCTWLEAWGLRRHWCTSLFPSHAAHPGQGPTIGKTGTRTLGGPSSMGWGWHCTEAPSLAGPALQEMALTVGIGPALLSAGLLLRHL